MRRAWNNKTTVIHEVSWNMRRNTCHRVQIESGRRRFYSWVFLPSGQIDHLTINSNHTRRWLLITNEIPRALPDEEKITAPCAGSNPPFRDRSLLSHSLSIFLCLVHPLCLFSNVFAPGGDRELNSPLSSLCRRDTAPELSPEPRRMPGIRPGNEQSEKTCLNAGPKCRRCLVSDEQLNKVEASICDDTRIYGEARARKTSSRQPLFRVTL